MAVIFIDPELAGEAMEELVDNTKKYLKKEKEETKRAVEGLAESMRQWKRKRDLKKKIRRMKK